jgi:hypothetical protein
MQTGARHIRWSASAEHVIAAIYVVVVAVYTLGAVLHSGPLGPRVVFGVDSLAYDRVAQSSFFSEAFLAGIEPVVFPLFLKVLLHNFSAVVIVQSAISAASWVFLAFTVSSVTPSRVGKVVGFVGILATSLALGVIVWNVAIMPESLGLSLFVLAIAFAIRAAAGADWALYALAVALALSAFLRDSAALVTFGVGVLAIGLIIFRQRKRAIVVLAVVCTLSGVLAVIASTHAERWYWRVADIALIRVLSDQEATDYFVDHGMPLTPQMQAANRDYAPSVPALNERAEGFDEFRTWVDERGRDTYSSFLLTHPGWVAFKPVGEVREMAAPEAGFVATTFKLRTDRFTNFVGGIGFPYRPGLVLGWSFLAFVAYAIEFRKMRGTERRVAYIVFAIALIAIPHAWAVWHGEALELNRHAIGVMVQLRIATWIMTATVLGIWIQRAAGRKAKEPA